MNRAVFLDRDGVITKDSGFVHKLSDFHLLRGAAEAIRMLNVAGFLVIVVTNQSGVARGIFSRFALEEFNSHMVSELAKRGARLDGIYTCPHHPEGKIKQYSKACGCRKPGPGLLLRAAKEHGIHLGASWMIGDRDSDMAAGKAAGCSTLLITKLKRRKGDAPAAPTLKEAVVHVLSHAGQ